MTLFTKPSRVLLIFAVVFLASACNNDEDPVPKNEEELITTVRLTFAPQGGGSTVTATYRDLDGDGGAVPTLTGAQLAANKVYNMTVAVLDETKNPVADITLEVKEEADEHQFFYVPSSGLNMTVIYTDQDSKNLPLGITTRATTASASSGTLRVVLKHLPGVKSANSTIATGETDVEVSFPITIQ